MTASKKFALDIMDEKQFSPAACRNAAPLLEQLKFYLAGREHVLEFSSGTGQHAAYFAERLNLTWQPSELKNKLASIDAWCQELNNVPGAIALNVADKYWPVDLSNFDAFFMANTTHIWPEATFTCFAEKIAHIQKDALLIIYGPFMSENTAASNLAFNAQLKAACPLQGLRHQSFILEQLPGFCLKATVDMPANNQLMIFSKNA